MIIVYILLQRVSMMWHTLMTDGIRAGAPTIPVRAVRSGENGLDFWAKQ